MCKHISVDINRCMYYNYMISYVSCFIRLCLKVKYYYYLYYYY